MNEKVIRVGIVGCGGIAAKHVKGYQTCGAKVTGVTDLNRASAEAMAATAGAECFPDLDSLLISDTVDAISICTPPVAHEEVAHKALARGIHVLCEKPMAHTVESAQRMIQDAEKSEALLMMAFRHRFLPAIQKLKEIIQSESFGPLVLFRNVFCGGAFKMKDTWFAKKAIAGGGTMMDTSPHSVDLFRYLCGEVVEQKAVMHSHFEGTDVEDASILIVKSGQGAVGSLMASWVAGDGMAFVDITGQSGRVIFDYTKSNEVRFKKRGEKDWTVFPVTVSDGFPEQIGHFLKAIRKEEKLSCTGQDGLRVVEIIQSCYVG